MPQRPTIVSLTPLALERDSRTFKIACSLSEAGYRSIVIEGEASAARFWGGEIEVRSLAAGGSGAGQGRRGAVAKLRRGGLGAAGEIALYAAYRGRDWLRHCRRAAAIIPPADLYYLHSFELHRAIAGRGAPIVYDAHDFYRGIEPPELLPPFDRKRLRPFLDRLENRLAAAAAAIVTVSPGVAALMEQAFRRRPTLIRNCHDARRDRPVAADLRARLGLSADDRLCVVVGNRKRGMALDAAVDALALLPERFHLAFVGRFYENDRDRWRAHPASHRLHFGHCVAPDEVVPFIRNADLGLVIYEPYSENYRFALPNGFFQKIAAGLPLVRGRLPEIEAAIGGRDIGECLDRLEPAMLAAAIERRAGVAALRQSAAELGRELSWEREAVALHRIIETVLRGRVPASSAALQAA